MLSIDDLEALRTRRPRECLRGVSGGHQTAGAGEEGVAARDLLRPTLPPPARPCGHRRRSCAPDE